MTPQKFPYWEWEDYQAGLYRLEWAKGRTPDDAMLILADRERLLDGMTRAVTSWPKAAAHHLTDGGMNQRAWLGWAACGILAQVPAHVTRAAWWRLTEDQRTRANDVADAVIASYVSPYHRTLFHA